MSTLFAAFLDYASAEKAAAALLDRGARAQDLSIVAGERYAGAASTAHEAESIAKRGITTTTGADAAAGAVKGTTVGLGIGVLGALAALFVPGLGLVIGGGALAAAVGAAAATTAAGAAAGGVAGYLRDQGMGEEATLRYSNAFDQGGAILSVNFPTGTLSPEEVEPYLVKYGAISVESHFGAAPITPPAVVTTPIPVTAPVVVEPGIVTDRLVTMPTMSADPNVLTPPVTAPTVAAAPIPPVRPTVVDPLTMEVKQAVTVDPLTEFERAPGFSLGDVTPLESDPVTGLMTKGTVTDPVTGRVRIVQVVNGSLVYLD